MDGALSPITPDWDNPQPYDGPTDEETDAFRRLQATADGIRAWVSAAYLHGTSPTGWTEFGSRLDQVAEMCLNLGRTVTGEIGSEPDHDHQP